MTPRNDLVIEDDLVEKSVQLPVDFQSINKHDVFDSSRMLLRIPDKIFCKMFYVLKVHTPSC